MHRLGSLVTAAERAEAKRIAAEIPYGEIREYRLDGLAVGEHAYAGTLRFFASGNLDAEPMGEIVARRYLEGALLTAFCLLTPGAEMISGTRADSSNRLIFCHSPCSPR